MKLKRWLWASFLTRSGENVWGEEISEQIAPQPTGGSIYYLVHACSRQVLLVDGAVDSWEGVMNHIPDNEICAVLSYADVDRPQIKRALRKLGIHPRRGERAEWNTDCPDCRRKKRRIVRAKAHRRSDKSEFAFWRARAGLTRSYHRRSSA